MLNPTFLHDIFGFKRTTGYSGLANRERLYNSETYTAILKAEWSVCLRALAEAMQQEWGTDYTRNRAIFTAALNIGIPETRKEKQVVTMRIRQPVCNAIGEGNFDAALSRLQEGLVQHPGLFSIVSHKSLEGADTTSQA